MVKPEHTKSSEIGTITSNVKEFQKNPIAVPISDYLKGSSIFEKEDEREISNLERANNRLKILKDTGIYDESQIAIVYNEVVELWVRIAWIYKKNVSLANQQIAEIKKVVEEHYITNNDSLKKIKQLSEELKLESKKSKPQEKDKRTNAQKKEDMDEEVEEDEKKLERQIKYGC